MDFFQLVRKPTCTHHVIRAYCSEMLLMYHKLV